MQDTLARARTRPKGLTANKAAVAKPQARERDADVRISCIQGFSVRTSVQINECTECTVSAYTDGNNYTAFFCWKNGLN